MDALEPLGADVQVEFCRPPTLEQMEELLRTRQEAGDPFDIVHFDGHGNFSKETQVGVLYFEEPADAFGRAATDPVSATALGDLLSRHAIPLVILEACRTATVGPTPVLASVASHLIDAGVGSVLAMSHAVHVEATRLLMDRFYCELVRGVTLDEAVCAAREALRDNPSRWLKAGPDGRTIELRDWFLPHLYHSAYHSVAGAALVPSRAHPGAEGAAKVGFRSPATGEEAGTFPPPPQFGFRGRAWERHELEHRLGAARGLVLHAMGGMGKTALATEAAHWWTRSGLFRDGACFVSFEQFMSADRVVQVLGTYLAGPKFEQLSAVEQRRRAIELFQQKSVLLVWDNFESVLPQFNDGAAGLASPYTADERRRLAELFYDLTKGLGNGCLLVTCRPGDTGLPGAQRYELQGLARADSLWLLASILEREGLTLADSRLSRDKLDPLLHDLDDHPLSLELVGPHLRIMAPEEIRVDFGELLATFKQKAPEERNQSLFASLEFSRRHLSPAAREALPWLGLFKGGGVFEILLLAVSKLTSEAWEPIRRELQGIALLRTESGVQLNNRPFLRFHPTLTFSVADPTFAQNPEIRQRFIGVYRDLIQVMGKVLTGSHPRIALEILSREEMSCRIAVQWAANDQKLSVAAALGETFSRYLQMLGRLRDLNLWVQYLKDATGRQEGIEEAFAYERQHAWSRFTQGDPQGAVEQLEALVERLRVTTEFDPAFELALSNRILGQVLDRSGAFTQAVPILREAVGQWKVLAEKAGGQPWEVLLASPDRAKAEAELGNLSGTMGSLANVLSHVGERTEALTVAEGSVEIQAKLGNRREEVTSHGLCASILLAAGRYDEADARYQLALAAAREAGDKDLEVTTLQNQGRLAIERNQLGCASHLHQQALKRSQEVCDHLNVMRAYNFLGVIDQKAGRLAEARAWYEKSRDLAAQLKNQLSLGGAAQNIGIIWLLEGKAARERGDEPTARRCFEEALASVEESLRIWQVQEDKLHEADSRSQLARIHLYLGDLAVAEHHAHRARKVHEPLGLKEAWKDYNTLWEIAQSRGDQANAAVWAKKRNDLFVEFELRAGGGGALS